MLLLNVVIMELFSLDNELYWFTIRPMFKSRHFIAQYYALLVGKYTLPKLTILN